MIKQIIKESIDTYGEIEVYIDIKGESIFRRVPKQIAIRMTDLMELIDGKYIEFIKQFKFNNVYLILKDLEELDFEIRHDRIDLAYRLTDDYKTLNKGWIDIAKNTVNMRSLSDKEYEEKLDLYIDFLGEYENKMVEIYMELENQILKGIS